jgi:hypothetical protein
MGEVNPRLDVVTEMARVLENDLTLVPRNLAPLVRAIHQPDPED